VNGDTSTTTILQWLVDTCRDLGLVVEGPDSDFFAAGGTSLTAVKLIERAEDVYGEDALTPEELFADSRLSDIAAAVERHVAERA
jgi:hypothetical protein